MEEIKIKDLRLRTIVGIYDWERETRQDVIVNIKIHFNGKKAGESDNIADTVDYKEITKQVIKKVESSQYFLIEKLTKEVLNIVMNNPKVLKASVKIDKPFALRFADSVSVKYEDQRNIQ